MGEGVVMGEDAVMGPGHWLQEGARRHQERKGGAVKGDSGRGYRGPGPWSQ